MSRPAKLARKAAALIEELQRQTGKALDLHVKAQPGGVVLALHWGDEAIAAIALAPATTVEVVRQIERARAMAQGQAPDGAPPNTTVE